MPKAVATDATLGTGGTVMNEEWRIKGKLLQELDTLRSRIAQLERFQHKKREERPSGFEEEFRSTFNNIAEGVLLTNPENGKCITCNRITCEMLGFDLIEIANLDMASLFLQEDIDYMKEQFEKQRNGESTVSKAILIKRRNGSLFLADIASVLFSRADKTYVMNILREIPSREIKTQMKLSTSTNTNEVQRLTAVEIRILRLIVRGLTSKEIAQLLHRSIRTIENHRAHLMYKLKVDNSVELTRKALAMKLVELPKGGQ